MQSRSHFILLIYSDQNDEDQKSLDQDIKEDVSQLKFDLDPIFISDQKWCRSQKLDVKILNKTYQD